MSTAAVALAAAGNVAAGAVAATVGATRDHWRTRRRPADEIPIGDWVVDDAPVTAQVFTVLGQLRRACLEQNQPPPGVELVLAGHDRLVVRLAQPTALPHFMPGWRPEAGDPSGRSWIVDGAELRAHDVAEAAETAYPMLVTVGTCDNWSVLLDLALTPAPLGVGGDEATARRLLDSLAFRLAANPWSRSVEIVVGGLPEPVVPEPGRVRCYPDPAAAVADATAREAERPLVLLLAAPPNDSQSYVMARHPNRAIVTVAGNLPATWTAEAAGALRLEPSGLRVDPRLTAVGSWQRRLRATRTMTRPPAVAREAPRDRHRDGRRGVASPRTPEAWRRQIASLAEPVLSDEARETLFPATVEVRLLGPWLLRTAGPIEPHLGPLLVDLLISAALRPDGVPEAEVPGMRSGLTRSEVARLAHDWLGAAADHLPLLRPRGDRWHLSPGARVDWHLFQAFLEPGWPGSERTRLTSALGLLRGPVLAAAPVEPATRRAARRHVPTIHAEVLRCVRRVMELSWQAGDLATAEWALRQGLLVMPGEEELWRGLVSVRLSQSRAAAAQVVDEMVVTLRATRRSTRLRRATRDLLRRAGLAVGGRRR